MTTMTAAVRPQSSMTVELNKPPRTLWSDAMRRFRRHKFALIGMTILLLFILASYLGPVIYGINPETLDFVNTLATPGTTGHPLGTDDLGRDLLARAFVGGRISLAVGFVAMLIAISVGSVVGAVSGFLGGKVDQLLMRITDLFLSLPVLPLLLLTVYLFREPVTKALGQERGIFAIVVVMIGGLAWMPTARILRASFLSLKQKEFVRQVMRQGLGRKFMQINCIRQGEFRQGLLLEH